MEKALRGGEGDNSTEAWRQGKRVNIHVKIISIKIIIKMTEDIIKPSQMEVAPLHRTFSHKRRLFKNTKEIEKGE